MSIGDIPSCAAIKRWEEAGVTLLTRFNIYTDMCINLGIDSLREGAKPEDVVSRIESVFETVRAAVSDQLAKTAAALSRTRNKLVSPILGFPEEVLLEIFTSVIFDYHSPEAPYRPKMERSVQRIYKHLHVLCGVCSTWRDIVVARGTLWSVIPTTHHLKSQPSLSLERAGASPLHLAANVIHNTEEEFYQILYQHGSRFRTINLRLHNYRPDLIGEIITRVVPYGTTGSLSELSVMYTYDYRSFGEKDEYLTFNPEPKANSYIFPRNSPQLSSFNDLLRSLTAFRIRRINLHWGDLGFSSRLVELRIEEIKLGYDDAIIPFLQALSSASELRDLQIIAIVTYYMSDPISNGNALPTVAFPKLRSPLLKGLYFNTLKLLLSMITPGSHHLTLFLNSKSTSLNIHRRADMPLNDPDDLEELEDWEDWIDETVDVEDQWSTLGPMQVDTLSVLGEGWGGRQQPWLKGTMLRTILSTMPALKTLQTHDWVFNEDDWDQRSKNFGRSPDTQGQPFPTLETLHLTRVTIKGRESFYRMVTSHPLRRIIIGGEDTNRNIQWYETRAFDPIQERSDLAIWLRNTVPYVRLVDSDYCPAEFSARSGWQLW